MSLLTATNGNVQLAAGALSDIPAGAFTSAVLFRRDGTTTDGFEALLALVASGSVVSNIGMDAAAEPYEVSFGQGGFTRTFGFNDLNDGDAYLFVVVKANGEVTPRGNLYRFDAGSPAWAGWADASGTVENRGDTITVAWLLNQPGGFPTNGGIWVAAVWNEALTEADVTHATTGLHIGVQQWLDIGAGPVALWRPGETDPVADESAAGTSDETSSTGVTITAGDPTNFSMDFGGPTEVTLAPATLTLTAQPLAPTPGVVTVALAPATLQLSAVTVDPDPGVVTVALTPAVLTLAGQPVTPTPGLVTVALAPAALALTAVALDPDPGPVTVALVPATLALTAQPLSPAAGAGSVALAPAELALVAVALTPTPGPVAVTLAPTVLTLAAVAFSFAPDGQVRFQSSAVPRVAMRSSAAARVRMEVDAHA